MKETRTNIEKSFRKGVIVLLLITIAFSTIILNKNGSSDISALLVGLPILFAGVIAIIGFIQGIKGLKEKKTAKMAFALFINFSVVLLFLGLIISNIIDILIVLK